MTDPAFRSYFQFFFVAWNEFKKILVNKNTNAKSSHESRFCKASYIFVQIRGYILHLCFL